MRCARGGPRLEGTSRPHRRPTPPTRSSPQVGYVVVIALGYLALLAWQLGLMRVRADDVLTFTVVLACGAVCVEATRRLGVPAGLSRDLLSAWWLPVALLLPAAYTLLAPIPMHLLLQLRVRAALPYRRVISAVAVGIAGWAASTTFDLLIPDRLDRDGEWFMGTWFGVVAALACGVVFMMSNMLLVGVAAYLGGAAGGWRSMLRDREELVLDVVELCLGVLVTIAFVRNPVLVAVALPPVVLLQRSLLHQQLQTAARTDGKTGVLNATAWERDATAAVARAQRGDKPLALLIVDIDHFKRVNDTYGHLAGDRVLVDLAATLRSHVRSADIVGRFGGEEFVVLLPRTDLTEARQVAERLRVSIARRGVEISHNDTSGKVSVTVSIGVVELRTHGEDLIEMLASADAALYQAKRTGRNRVCVPAAGAPRTPAHQPPNNDVDRLSTGDGPTGTPHPVSPVS